MPSEHVASSYDVARVGGAAGARAGWRDGVWEALVSGIDAVLRRCYGVYEYSSDPDCVLRVGLSPARAALRLSDGTDVAPGEIIGVCHFWNEHLPRFAGKGPDLRWAKTIQRRMHLSLHQLACHVASDPDWSGVRAIKGEPALARLRAYQMRRLAKRYGFDMVASDKSGLRQVHDLGENFLIWCFARAFNPAALRRHIFRRRRYELWISREALLARYGARPADLPDRGMRPWNG